MENEIQSDRKPLVVNAPPPAQFLGVEDFNVRDANERQLKMLDNQGNLDKQVISRIKDMKQGYERQINEYIKDKTTDNIKIEALAKRI